MKEVLQISIDAAKHRAEPLDHVLLYGPPGLGKTTMAQIIATEMGASVKITSAPALERPRDIAGLLAALKPGDVLFIDEIHRLNRMAEEILYPAFPGGADDLTRIVRDAALVSKSLKIRERLFERLGMRLHDHFHRPPMKLVIGEAVWRTGRSACVQAWIGVHAPIDRDLRLDSGQK